MALKFARNHTQKHPLVSGSPYWQGVELHVSAKVYCIMVKSLSLSFTHTHSHTNPLEKYLELQNKILVFFFLQIIKKKEGNVQKI